MINPGYKISSQEEDEMREFKDSAAYSTYLKAISSSPAFAAVMRDHIQNINITEDIKLLKNDGKLPDGVSARALNELFKQSLSKMAIGLVADTVILKELEDANVSDILNGIKKDSDIVYLLGEADQKYYSKAAKLVEEGRVNKESIAFRGLVAYMSKNEKLKNSLDIKEPKPKKKEKVKEIKEAAATTPDFDSNDITL